MQGKSRARAHAGACRPTWSMSTSTRRKPKFALRKRVTSLTLSTALVRAALATPGSGECRFEMGPPAPEEKPGQTVMQPAAPAPAARPATSQPKKGGFTTLSAAEYRALNGLTAARACAPAADGAGRSECTGHTACPGRVRRHSPRSLPTRRGPAPRPLTPVTPVTAVETPASEPVTIPAPQPMPHAVSDDTVLDILPELPDEAPATDLETITFGMTPHALSALPDMVSTRPEQTTADPAACKRAAAPCRRGVQDLYHHRARQ